MDNVQQLPLFEGHRPDVTEVKLSGKASAKEQHFSIGQGVYFLVRGRVTGVNHERKDPAKPLVRSHKVEIVGVEHLDAKEIVSEQLVQDAYTYLKSIDDDSAPEEEVG